MLRSSPGEGALRPLARPPPLHQPGILSPRPAPPGWPAPSRQTQVGRECDLPVQSRVAAGVDDLHDDVRADVHVMGAALGGGNGPGSRPRAAAAIARAASGACRRSVTGGHRAWVDGALARFIRVSTIERMSPNISSSYSGFPWAGPSHWRWLRTDPS